MSSFTEATVTSIQCTVKRICSDKKDRSRQFAFLKPVQGGRDIFAAHNFISQLPSGNGRQFRCEVVGPPQKRSVTRILKSGQPSWKLWQAGQDPLSLPDTQPGSDHGELRFCCAACGTTIVEGHDIFKIKGGAIWTNSTNTMMLPLVDSGSDVWNKFKKVHLRDAYCKCALPNLKVENIGAYYAQEYEDKDASKEGPKKQFPCYKLNYGRKNRNGRIAKLILDAPTRQAAVEQLSLLSNVGADSHKSRINSKTPSTNSERDEAQAAKKELYKLQGETKEMELRLNAKSDEAQKTKKYIRQIHQQHVYQQQLQQQQQQVVQQARREYTQKMQHRLDIEKEDRTKADRDRATAENLANDMVRQCQALSIELGEYRPWVLNPTDKTCCEVLTRLGKHVPNVALCQEPELSRRTAIRSYTGNDVYNECNCAARERQGSNFERWSPFIWHLVQGLNALPDVEATVYRGIQGINPQDYKRNKKIHWSGFTSTSTNPAVSRSFGGVMFEIQVVNGKDIQGQSQYQQEREILLSPHMEFVVTQECGRGGGGGMIKLQQIPSETLWS